MRGALTVQEGNGGPDTAHAHPQSTMVDVVVTRANGRVEKHGTVGYWHRNPVMHALGVAYYRIDNLMRRVYYGVTR